MWGGLQFIAVGKCMFISRIFYTHFVSGTGTTWDSKIKTGMNITEMHTIIISNQFPIFGPVRLSRAQSTRQELRAHSLIVNAFLPKFSNDQIYSSLLITVHIHKTFC